MKTLKEVEGLVSKGQKSIAGAKGDLKGGEEVVVRQLLDKDMYTQEELEAEMGMPLEDLFGSNPSQMRCLAVAGQNGALSHCLSCCSVDEWRDIRNPLSACAPWNSKGQQCQETVGNASMLLLDMAVLMLSNANSGQQRCVQSLVMQTLSKARGRMAFPYICIVWTFKCNVYRS